MGVRDHILQAFPFESRWYRSEEGVLHYLDEGNGPILLFLHGNPTWSYAYREPIRILSHSFRCIALDHLGFGLSDKPIDGDLSPQAHSRRLASFIQDKGLKDLVLIMNDWGGPIGMHSAQQDPDRYRGFVVLNSWLGSPKGHFLLNLYSRVVGGRLGRFSIRYWNALISWGMPWGFAKTFRFTPRLRQAYEYPFQEASQRRGQWISASAIRKEQNFQEEVRKGAELLKDNPLLILTGQKDPALGKKQLRNWQEAFPHARTEPIADAGHFPQEEQGEQVAQRIALFLASIDPGRCSG